MTTGVRLNYLQAMDIVAWRARPDSGLAQEAAPPNFAAAAEIAPARAEISAPDTHATWQALQAQVRDCRACRLHESRTQTVFGVGDPHAQWMVIGEGPGADEDRQGEPFVGKAGQLLNAMLLAVGLQREQVYIANIVKCRPPNNRDPAPDEAAACMGYLQRQIDLIKPKLILSVGKISASNLLQRDDPIGRLRGTVHRFGKTPVVVTYHPAYLLRSPLEKRKAWQDLQFAQRVVRQAL